MARQMEENIRSMLVGGSVTAWEKCGGGQSMGLQWPQYNVYRALNKYFV
jgi:hypothetical protein